MNRVISSEFDTLIKINRITVTVYYGLECDVAASIPLLKTGDVYDPLALDLYEEFIINVLAIFDAHDFEILEEHESPYSKSNYFSLVKKSDKLSNDYKYILFVRISDHNNREETKKSKKNYYANLADKLKQPTTKSKQRWKLKEIVVNNSRYFSYEDALTDIESRLSNT